MYLISTNDIKKFKLLEPVLAQNKFVYELDSILNFFGKLVFDFKENSLDVIYEKKSKNFKFPFIYSDLITFLHDISSNTKLKIDKLIYYPGANDLQYINNKINLRDTHNIILSTIYIHNLTGIKKNDLCKILWPHDYETHVNKLDTHLTNLKQLVLKELNYDLKIKSENGLLSININ